MEEHIKSENADEFKEHIEDIIKRLRDAISNGRPFFVIASGENETMATAGGTKMDIVKTLAVSMSKANHLEDIVRTAIDALEYGREQGIRKSVGVDIEKLVKGEMINIAKSLDCENCAAKEDCKIFNLLAKDLDKEGISKLLDELHKKHPEIVQVMSKGGDA